MTIVFDLLHDRQETISTGEFLMKHPAFNTCVSVAALAVAGLATPAFAADQAPAAATTAAPADTLAEIVVTASTGTKSKLDSSVSISSVSADVINDFHPMSEGDLLRLLPGIQPNVSGPGGNGNFAVRGLPVTTGGATFVQLQEDGLPFILYGDMQFGNNDYWTKSSPTDERLDAIRGGTTATFASQAPGAVINYISKTSRSQGGYVEAEEGVNYNYTKLKFLDSGVINDSTYYNVGGYYDVGHGPKHADYNVSNSYLIKGNITHDLDDNRGFFRLLFKVADTHEPNDTGGLACGNVTNSVVTSIGACPGFDGRKQSIYSLYNANVQYVDFNSGGLASHPLDGISTQQKSLQAQLHYNFDNGLTLDENARYSQISGGFASNFFGNGLVSSLTAGGQKAIYAAGPNVGQAVTDTYYNNNVEVFTNIRSLNNFVNDTKLNWKGSLGGDIRANLTAGWFYMNQQIAMDWHPSEFSDTVTGVPIDVYSAAGNLLTANGYAGYNNNWGACCARTYDYTFTDNAPYADLILDAAGFEFDGSIRHDINHGQGVGTPSSGVAHTLAQTVPDPLHGGTTSVNIPYFLPDGTSEVINYTTPTTSWSVGLSYKPAANTNLFVRASKGVRFNADRMTFNGYFTGAGTLDAAGQAAVTDTVYQYEIGLKNRGSLGAARYTTELTVFYSHFNITTYELSQIICPIITGNATTYTCIESDKYKTAGLESYSTLTLGGLSAIANLTYNKGKEEPVGGSAYGRANNIPDLDYSLAVNYKIVPQASVGFDLVGTSSVRGGDGIVYPGSAVVSANVKYTPVSNFELGLNVYNLFNSFALLGGAGGTNGVTNGAFVGSASFTNGRMVTASAKFKF